jgi:hypothetical protein
MPEDEYIYQDRAVAFVDVLGFREKLDEFERDAQTKKMEGAEYLISGKVNEFINTFKRVTSLLDSDNFRYYLFSDNICITVDYVDNPELLISLLFTLSELFYSFAEKGYFLRGGVDVGKFVDEQEIALGLPLAKAYEMESKQAVYPRILISPRYTELLKNYLTEHRLPDNSDLSNEQLIHKSCEFFFLNVFYNVIRKEDKVAFFESFRRKITEHLLVNRNKESIYIKYEWLAKQYNAFLDLYTDDLIYREEHFDPPPELIEQLKTLKI